MALCHHYLAILRHEFLSVSHAHSFPQVALLRYSGQFPINFSCATVKPIQNQRESRLNGRHSRLGWEPGDFPLCQRSQPCPRAILG
jgi:hypothetical protein